MRNPSSSNVAPIGARGSQASDPGRGPELDAIIIGAGFAGLYMLHRLRRLGLSARIYEAGSGVGGTWFWNRYPGARCDVESVEYSYSFSDELQQEWTWSERYASQPEILKYLNHVADRFDLRRDIQLESRVISAAFNERTRRWDIRLADGSEASATYCIMAAGNQSTPHVPDLKGLKTFKGRCLHTADWPSEDVDLRGKRVGVVGTGSTAIQAIPLIAQSAAHLFAFQRTPAFSVPARNRPLTPGETQEAKQNYAQIRQSARTSSNGAHYLNVVPPGPSALGVAPDEREREYERRWNRGGALLVRAYADILTNGQANATAADFVRNKIREIVKDPERAEALCPQDYPIATKRVCIDTDYYETYNRENVTLVNVRKTPIEEITEDGIRTSAATYPLDCIVFATGFDAMTGALLAIDPRGKGGVSLSDKWRAGPRTYLGLMTAGFPNLFLVTGPGSPSVLSNVVTSIEQHVEWIADCIGHMRLHGFDCIEALEEAENVWVNHVNDVANMTLFPQAKSWYTGANIPGKPNVFMPYVGGVGAYRVKCDEVVAGGYTGFALSASPAEVEAVSSR
ncbi:MAG: NAD(P)/FAD-dependent oxidoreductase [Burkholderiales bacterium]|nr:NAD(P)/FAD-dependent oxidoreductase [Burkholderiales bacterium]